MTRYTYYLEPKDSHTNEVLSRELGEECHRQVRCADGKRHNLWECDYDTYAKFLKSQLDINLKLCGWRKRGNGQIEPWPPVKTRA